MKKQLICMLAAAAMLPSATAFAAGSYDADANNVTVNDSSKKTVIIARNTGATMMSDDIVYVGQENEGFSGASAIFKLKAEPAVGFYTIMLGGDGNAATTGTFFIGSAEQFENRTELKVIDNYEVESEDKTTVTKAYASDTDIELANVKSIVVTYGEKSVCTELGTVTSGGGTAKLAVELKDIPAANKNDVTVWVSSTEISTAALITE